LSFSGLKSLLAVLHSPVTWYCGTQPILSCKFLWVVNHGLYKGEAGFYVSPKEDKDLYRDSYRLVFPSVTVLLEKYLPVLILPLYNVIIPYAALERYA